MKKKNDLWVPLTIAVRALLLELDAQSTKSVETHPYAKGGARSRADRARSIGVLSLKALDVHPDLDQPGATASNAYCLE